MWKEQLWRRRDTLSELCCHSWCFISARLFPRRHSSRPLTCPPPPPPHALALLVLCNRTNCKSLFTTLQSVECSWPMKALIFFMQTTCSVQYKSSGRLLYRRFQIKYETFLQNEPTDSKAAAMIAAWKVCSQISIPSFVQSVFNPHRGKSLGGKFSPACVHRLWSKLCRMIWSAYCGKLVQWREGNSHWRCVTYIQQLQTHLFCSGAASALPLSLSSVPFPLILSLPAAILLVRFILLHPTVRLRQSPSSFWQFSSPAFIPASLSCVFYMCRCDRQTSYQSNCIKSVLRCSKCYKTTSPRIPIS